MILVITQTTTSGEELVTFIDLAAYQQENEDEYYKTLFPNDPD